MRFLVWLFFLPLVLFGSETPLKVLHLTFHRGCANEIEALAKQLSLELTTWYIPDLPPYFFDGCSTGCALYNMGHERAANVWNLHEQTFREFDIIITSDTAPLARIFLQSGSNIPLIVWICNRFDYCDEGSLDCEFPDREFYQLFNQAKHSPHVMVIANTAFEHHYARSKGVDTGTLIIKPSGFCDANEGEENPSQPQREQTVYLPHYHNEHLFMDLSKELSNLGIKNFCGRHNGLGDLAAYKAIVHLPYSWSTIALFENIKIGIPYFVPSSAFLQKLQVQGPYWHQNGHFLFQKNLYRLSEWYDPEHRAIITYFDSWQDLKGKLRRMDYEKKRWEILEFAKKHQEKTLSAWRNVFKHLEQYCQRKHENQ